MTPEPAAATQSSDAAVTLVGMGFTTEQAMRALASTNGSLERAADLLISG